MRHNQVCWSFRQLVLLVAVMAGSDASADEPVTVDSSSRLHEAVVDARQRIGHSDVRAMESADFFAALASPTLGVLSSPSAVEPAANLSLNVTGPSQLDGVVFKEGLPFLHNDGGLHYFNTALGLLALPNAQIDNYGYGSRNTAVGQLALFNTTTGIFNTAVGVMSAYYNETGSFNTAIGTYALPNESVGGTAVGFGAHGGTLNTAIGFQAGKSWGPSGQDNVAIGTGAYGYGTDTGTIRIGGKNYQSRTFIEGIRGASYPATFYFDELVCTNALDQLGPCGGPSSARFKDGIQEMRAVSEALDSLQPVTFHYKKRTLEADGPPHYGLIAEEVAKVFPHLVRYDEEGKPYSIRYELLTPMLLKDLQDEKQRREAEVEDLRRQVAELRKVVGDLKRREEIQRE